MQIGYTMLPDQRLHELRVFVVLCLKLIRIEIKVLISNHSRKPQNILHIVQTAIFIR
jgi:hypothetical protein